MRNSQINSLHHTHQLSPVAKGRAWPRAVPGKSCSRAILAWAAPFRQAGRGCDAACGCQRKAGAYTEPAG